MREDTKDVLSVLLFIIGAAIMFGAFGYSFGQDHNRPGVGGDDVPHGLTCEEDEVIGYDPLDMNGPRPLTCVHIDNYAEVGR